MKKWAISLVILILMCGCSAESEIERGMAFRSAILKAQGCVFDAEVTAEYPEYTYTFQMNCSFDEQGSMAFAVISPNTIAGITGTVSHAYSALTFDGEVLYIDLMTDDQLNPVSAPWILMKTLRSGYLTSACVEEGYLRLTMDDSYEDCALHLDIWLDADDIPVRGEVVYNGRRILAVAVSQFRIL